MLIRRIVRGVTYAFAGNLLGTAVGLIAGFMHSEKKLASVDTRSEEEVRESKRDHLVGHVRQFGTLRKLIETATLVLTDGEYKARRELESMGYYPCSTCGVPHIDGGTACMPPGTYYSEALERYIEPGHPDWSAEEYTRVTGEPWVASSDEDDDTRH